MSAREMRSAKKVYEALNLVGLTDGDIEALREIVALKEKCERLEKRIEGLEETLGRHEEEQARLLKQKLADESQVKGFYNL